MIIESLNNSDANSIRSFFEYIFDEEEGFAYLATKSKDNQFTQHFFAYPHELNSLVEMVIATRSYQDVYYAPSLFSEPVAQKQYVKGARVFWTEWDGNAPTEYGNVPAPSCIVQSSDETHLHCYWKTSEVNDVETLELINRGITYSLDADSSSWDATQILRVVETVNHKRQLPVKQILINDQIVSAEAFSQLPKLPPLVETPIPTEIPAVEDVISKYVFPKHVWKLFKSLPSLGDRSTAMMQLGYELAEMQLTNEEILSCLLNADARWKKFSERSDQLQRLTDLITKARAKYPYKGQVETKLISLGLKTLLATEVHLKWIIERYLEENGCLLLSGPSSVGKTQFSLSAAEAMILGYPFLNSPTVGDLKIGFFSLEMGLMSLKYFLKQQAQAFNPEELEKLEKNLRLFPLGQPLYINQLDEQARIKEVIEREELDGIVIDSLGSTSTDELSQEGPAKVLMDWNDRLRQETGVFTWFIHHNRKATGDNKKPKRLADVYGSQYLTARPTTVISLWPEKGNKIEVLPVKVRLSEAPEPFLIVRDKNLQFQLTDSDKKEGVFGTAPAPIEVEEFSIDGEEESF